MDNKTNDYGLWQPQLEEVAPTEIKPIPPLSIFSNLNSDDFTIEDVYRTANIKLPVKH